MDELCDKVQEIVDATNVMRPEIQTILLNCATGFLKAEVSAEQSAPCAPEIDEKS